MDNCGFLVPDRLMNRSSQQTERLTQSGLNLIQQALTIYDSNLMLSVCNSRFAEMFSLPSSLTEPGAPFADTIRFLAERGEYGNVADVEAFVAERVEQARAFEPHYMERQRANGRTISVEGSPLRQGGWVTVYTDITSIKRQEQLLRSRSEELSDQLLAYSEDLSRANRELASTIATLEETKRQLTLSEALSRTTSEMMPAHIAHFGLDERYTYSNQKLASVLPGCPSDIIGLTAHEALGDEIYAAIKPWIRKAFNGEANVFEFSHAQGARRVRAAFTPGRNASGEVSGIYILTMDVTEETQTRAALLQTHKRELAAQLTSGVAHDFANLLTIILGLQGQLEKRRDLSAEVQEIVATTRAAALRGGMLLDRLSNISGRRDLRPVATDVARLLSDIASMATPSLPGSVELCVDHTGLDRPVLVDAGLLQDSLLNLVLNARDAIGSHSGQIEIVACPVEEIWLQFSISDSGEGFSKDALDHAIEPFFSTKSSDEGTGLGLSMVYDFAQMSGGTLRLANRPQGGAEVVLRLPLRLALSENRPRFVLLVEDNSDIRAATRNMLRDAGHTVIEATSAEEAERLASIPGLDTLLSDIAIEGSRNGLDLAHSIRAQNEGISIVMMTSLPPENQILMAAEAEFPLLPKPFDRAALDYALETRK